MKRIKKMLFIFLIGFVFLESPKALEEKKFYVDNGEKRCGNVISEVYIPNSLSYDGEEVSLYCEFKNPEKALKVVNDNYSNLLEEYSIYENITKDNYENIYSKLLSIEEENIENENLRNLFEFFDIYENTFTNQIIRSLVNKQKISTNMDINNYSRENDEVKQEINNLIPLYANKLSLNSSQTFAISKSKSGMRTNKALAYAEKYATNPNSVDYEVYDADCTNFVSQIVYESGVSQVVGINRSFGWWHMKNALVHTNSFSWSKAADFVNYWGADYKNHDFATFTSKLYLGDVIGYDKTNDGSVDHLGFVTARSQQQYSYIFSNGNHKIYYYDIKIAQHTSNYNDWTSGLRCNWEKMSEYSDIMFYMVRFW